MKKTLLIIVLIIFIFIVAIFFIGNMLVGNYASYTIETALIAGNATLVYDKFNINPLMRRVTLNNFSYYDEDRLSFECDDLQMKIGFRISLAAIRDGGFGIVLDNANASGSNIRLHDYIESLSLQLDKMDISLKGYLSDNYRTDNHLNIELDILGFEYDLITGQGRNEWDQPLSFSSGNVIADIRPQVDEFMNRGDLLIKFSDFKYSLPEEVQYLEGEHLLKTLEIEKINLSYHINESVFFIDSIVNSNLFDAVLNIEFVEDSINPYIRNLSIILSNISDAGEAVISKIEDMEDIQFERDVDNNVVIEAIGELNNLEHNILGL
ncbi:hypothetical protein [Natronospora cellulosivora (SeqCode)]